MRVDSGERDAHRAMVAAHHVGVDGGVFHGFAQGFGDEEVIDSPSDVALSGIDSIGPPTVLARLFMKFTKRIDVAKLNNSAITKILDVISEVESTSKLTDAGSFKLHQLDSQLRTQIQLDPLGVGTLTNLAAKMADAAVANDSWLNVRALYGDSQIFELPEKVENAFVKFACEVPAGSSIQVLASGAETTLSMRIFGASLAEVKSNFDPISEDFTESEIDFALEENTDENEVVLLLTKKLDSDEEVI